MCNMSYKAVYMCEEKSACKTRRCKLTQEPRIASKWYKAGRYVQDLSRILLDMCKAKSSSECCWLVVCDVKAPKMPYGAQVCGWKHAETYSKMWGQLCEVT